jgi:hypothetical protein
MPLGRLNRTANEPRKDHTMTTVAPALTSDSQTWPRGLAVEVIVNELTRLGHGPIADDGPGLMGGFLTVADAPSFALLVNPVGDTWTWTIKVEWQSALEPTGHEVTGRLCVDLNLVDVCRDIHDAIERHKVDLGIYAAEKEAAQQQLAEGIDRLHERFDLDPFGNITVGGKVDERRRPRFEVTVADLTEADAGRVLEALTRLGLVGR